MASILMSGGQGRLKPSVGEFLRRGDAEFAAAGDFAGGVVENVGLDVRTLERHFHEELHTTPKAWIMRARMSYAPPLLADGLSNKQVAAALSYTCESNFCRDFKRHFGRAPQEFAHI